MLLQTLCIASYIAIVQTKHFWHPYLTDTGDKCNPLDTEEKNVCNDMEYCDKSGICKHKALFPMKGQEIWGLVSITFLMLLCTAGGIGGGVVVAPMCIAFFEFGLREAVPLSGFCILICQVTKFAYSWK